MTTKEIGASLVALCQAGKLDEAYPTLFADNAVSIEGTGDITRGLPAILDKADEFDKETTISDLTVRGPFVADNTFAVLYAMTMTTKATGAAFPFEEIAVYTVADGKIVEEKFLYGV